MATRLRGIFQCLNAETQLLKILEVTRHCLGNAVAVTSTISDFCLSRFLVFG